MPKGAAAIGCSSRIRWPKWASWRSRRRPRRTPTRCSRSAARSTAYAAPATRSTRRPAGRRRKKRRPARRPRDKDKDAVHAGTVPRRAYAPLLRILAWLALAALLLTGVEVLAHDLSEAN